MSHNHRNGGEAAWQRMLARWAWFDQARSSPRCTAEADGWQLMPRVVVSSPRDASRKNQMRLTRVDIRNFKGVKEFVYEFPAESTGPGPLTVIVGDNGSGKTSVLQAIALVLSLATRKTYDPKDLAWDGFMAERTSTLGPTRVELDVEFDPDEIECVASLYPQWAETRPADWLRDRRLKPPAKLNPVTLVYERERLGSPQKTRAALYQFWGRYYVATMPWSHLKRREMFSRIGDVFWFDQHRSLGTTMRLRSPRDLDSPAASERRMDEVVPSATEGWRAGVSLLRDDLIRWWGYHTSKPASSSDYLAELETRLASIFAGTKFVGIRPREASGDSYFLLSRDGHEYDLAEMSSGEQAVFPLLYEFIRLNIAKSVVLIDELELHLHPPQQQALFRALRRIGPGCQFILTTHSPAIEEVTPPEEKLRMEGGRLCPSPSCT